MGVSTGKKVRNGNIEGGEGGKSESNRSNQINNQSLSPDNLCLVVTPSFLNKTKRNKTMDIIIFKLWVDKRA